MKACCLFESSAAKVKIGQLLKSETDVLMLLISMCDKLGLKKHSSQCVVLTDFITIVNKDKCDPTSCSTFLSSRVWKPSIATQHTSFSLYQSPPY